MNGEERYLIAGGTSDTGNRVVKGLVSCIGARCLTCIVRKTSAAESVEFLRSLGVNLVVGDVTDPVVLADLLASSTTYLDMTHPKYYHQSIEVVGKAGIRRAFFITTTGLYSKYNDCSEIYKVGETRIKNSGVDYTIIRPSMIYGTERDRNMTRLLRYLSKWPVFPVFGDGLGLMQPVYVQDLADGIVKIVSNPELTRGKEYNLCGPTAISFTKLIEIACEALNKRVHIVHIPHAFAATVAGWGEHFPGFPIKKEQVLRLLEDKAFDISLAQKDLGYNPREFSAGIREEVSCLRAKGIL